MTEVDPLDETIGRWIVFVHQYDHKTKHFRYMPIAAYTTEREFMRRFKLESKALDARSAKGEAHFKETISGRWKGENPPSVALWKRALRFTFNKFSGKKYIHLYESGYAEYEAFLRGENLDET
jgi:hypothetical protein